MSELPFEVVDHLPLGGETVVFAGKLWSLGRRDARALVERLGGASDEELTLRTTMLVLGAERYPEGPPEPARLERDTSASSAKLRRAVQLNVDQPGRIRILSEDQFCRLVGLPGVAALRTQHYGQRDILTMYPRLREDHLRYLQKWGFLRPAFRNNADTWFAFADLTVLRQVHAEMTDGASFRAVLRGLQATRTGQLTFDFRLDAEPARILALEPRRPRVGAEPLISGSASAASRPLTTAEQHFLTGSLLDDGTQDRIEEAAQAYRRALEADPNMVAALINLANIRYACDELAEALALYERAISLDPTYFEAHFNLGNIHHDYGQYREAERCYAEALALNPGYAEAHFYLAVTLEKMGRPADARAHWKHYQTLAPDGEWVELAREFSD
ncbi:MAG: tetratricopeptide repeat protein [Vicinamibacterales bacterium]